MTICLNFCAKCCRNAVLRSIGGKGGEPGSFAGSPSIRLSIEVSWNGGE